MCLNGDFSFSFVAKKPNQTVLIKFYLNVLTTYSGDWEELPLNLENIIMSFPMFEHNSGGDSAEGWGLEAVPHEN